MNLFETCKGLKLNQIEKMLGRENIIMILNYDANRIRHFIKEHMGKNSNPARYFKEYEKLTFKLQSNKDNVDGGSSLLQELSNALKDA